MPPGMHPENGISRSRSDNGQRKARSLTVGLFALLPVADNRSPDRFTLAHSVCQPRCGYLCELFVDFQNVVAIDISTI